MPSTSSTSTEGPSASNSWGSTLTFTPCSRARQTRSNSASSSKSSRATTIRSAPSRSTTPSSSSSPTSSSGRMRPRQSDAESEIGPDRLHAVLVVGLELGRQGRDLGRVADQHHRLGRERGHREPPGDGPQRRCTATIAITPKLATWRSSIPLRVQQPVVREQQQRADQHGVEDPRAGRRAVRWLIRFRSRS